MKVTIIAILLIVVFFDAKSQLTKHDIYRYQIDTLSVSGDSLLAKITTFRNEKLMEEKTAYMIPDSVRVSRFRFLRDLFQRTIYADRISKQGKTFEYLEDGKKKIAEYQSDSLIRTMYFNKNNDVISAKEFYENVELSLPSSTGRGEYFFHGKRKNNH